MQLINKIKILSLIILLILSISFSSKASAQSDDDSNTGDVPTAVSGYASSATFCPPGFNFFRPGGVGKCCPTGSSPSRASSFDFTCYDTNANQLPHTKSRGWSAVVAPISRRICRDGEYLVERSGITNNYCISSEEKVGLGSDADLFFLACRENSPVLTVDQHSPGNDMVGSKIGTVPLPAFCEGNNGILSASTDVCICGGQTAPTDLTGGESCQTACNGNVLFDGTNSSSGPGPNAACEADQRCKDCAANGFTYTALGCIDTSREGLVLWLIRFSIGLVMIILVFRFIQASMLIRSGDPEKIKEGQEIVTSAIIAFVLILIAVPLLEFIGVRVLNIFPQGFIQEQ